MSSNIGKYELTSRKRSTVVFVLETILKLELTDIPEGTTRKEKIVRSRTHPKEKVDRHCENSEDYTVAEVRTISISMGGPRTSSLLLRQSCRSMIDTVS